MKNNAINKMGRLAPGILLLTCALFGSAWGGVPVAMQTLRDTSNLDINGDLHAILLKLKDQAAQSVPAAQSTAIPDPSAANPEKERANHKLKENLSPSASDRYNALIWNRSYQGDWFEWWYYKVVLPETRDAFYFCYGVVNPWDLNQSKATSRSYVHVGSFGDQDTFEQMFTPGDFAASSTSTFIQIGDNIATDRMLKGHLLDPNGEEISWDLTLEKDWAFNAMGWAMSQGWISNIFWYPAQAGASMSGQINYRGRTIRLDHAPAYQDRNWGKSFPKWWTWLVSNHFNNSPGTVLAVGGGQPKVFPGTDFYEGVSIGLLHEGREYIFRPTNGHHVNVDVSFGKWEVSASNHKRERIEISAYAPREKFLLLEFMTPQGKIFNDYEALVGHIRVKLYKGSKLLADIETDVGGIEYGSFDKFDFEMLFSGQKRLQ